MGPKNGQLLFLGSHLADQKVAYI